MQLHFNRTIETGQAISASAFLTHKNKQQKNNNPWRKVQQVVFSKSKTKKVHCIQEVNSLPRMENPD